MLTQPYRHEAYKPGDVIVEHEMPLIYLLYPGNVSHCAGCFTNKSLKPDESGKLNWEKNKLWACGHCYQFRYCGRMCQRHDWENFHRYECPIYAQHGQDPMLALQSPSESAVEEDKEAKLTFVFLTRIALRCLTLVTKRQKDMNHTEEIFGKERGIRDLEDQKEESKTDILLTERIDAIHSFFKQIKVESIFGKYNFVHVRRLLFKFRINSYSINDMIEWKPLGGGMYLKASFFDHSCLPNAAIIFQGMQMQVRAIKDIPEDEPIYVSYVNILKGKAFRKKVLMENYYFECGCPRCKEDEKEFDDQVAMQEELLKLLDVSTKAHGGTSGHKKEYFETYTAFIKQFDQLDTKYRLDSKYQPAIMHHKVLYVIKFLSSPVEGATPPFDVAELSEDMKVTFGQQHPLTQHFAQVINSEKAKNLFSQP